MKRKLPDELDTNIEANKKIAIKPLNTLKRTRSERDETDHSSDSDGEEIKFSKIEHDGDLSDSSDKNSIASESVEPQNENENSLLLSPEITNNRNQEPSTGDSLGSLFAHLELGNDDFNQPEASGRICPFPQLDDMDDNDGFNGFILQNITNDQSLFEDYSNQTSSDEYTPISFMGLEDFSHSF